VQTDRTIPNNKPDIINCDHEKETCMLINVKISGERNVIKKEFEEILKNKHLMTETQCMQNVKTQVIPVITGATGTTSKSFITYLSHVTGKHETMEQKTAIMGTTHILWKVLM
jgi:hypothetical protein